MNGGSCRRVYSNSKLNPSSKTEGAVCFPPLTPIEAENMKKIAMTKEEIERRLLDALKRCAWPYEGLMREALAPDDGPDNQLIACEILADLQKRGKVEFNGGWYRVIDEPVKSTASNSLF
jgi:hypothetical protein